MTRLSAFLAIALLVLLGVLAASPSSSAGKSAALIRVDQLGYLPTEAKHAYVLAPGPVPGASFAVTDRSGRVRLTGTVGASRGRWNAHYGAVHLVDLTRLRRPGRYRIRLTGPLSAVSPWFRIAGAVELTRPRVADAVAFFQAQRDGASVIAGPLHRLPAHLHDRTARVYAFPRYENADSDVIVGQTLKPIAAPVDLEGGWFDAGDFVKFTHTTAYADVMLLATQRALGRAAPPTLLPEARFGLRWLDKAWAERDGVLLFQVGIGSGNTTGTFNGDHDLWRLPEVDDTLEGAANRYLRNRPAFRANRPGQPLPPNLAGRVAAAFALAAQVDAARRPALARTELETAAAVFAAAKTRDVRAADVVTALPHAFYPESSWRDDLELAGAELALAGTVLDDSRSSEWLAAAARFARGYLRFEAGRDTLNLYDTSALAHADLVRAIRASAGTTGLAVGQSALLADLRAQLGRGATRARRDPFGAGVTYSDFDAAPHAFGLAATAALYRDLTGDARFAALGTAQRDWALGANAWGSSLMIGVGETFPLCPQHVVANLSGRQDGHAPILRGAVVNGPNDATLFADGLDDFFEEGHTCPAPPGDPYADLTGHGSRFVDDVRAWQTVEPALDFTAVAALAFALT